MKKLNVQENTHVVDLNLTIIAIDLIKAWVIGN